MNVRKVNFQDGGLSHKRNMKNTGFVKILTFSSLLFLTGCGGKNNEELLDAFLADEIPAYYYVDGTTDTVMRSDFPYNEEDFYSYSVGERIDLDNDGEREQIMNGPNGGVYFDARDGKVYILAEGEGTAGMLSYTHYDDAVWIVHSDVMHGGRQMYWLTKYDGDGNVVDEFTLGAEYWDSPPGTGYDENSVFTYRDEEISMEEYEALWKEIFAAKSTSVNTTEGTEEQAGSPAELTLEQTDAYEQMTLYLQEGFRKYAVEGSYHALFGPIEATGENFCCDILLIGEEDLWSDSVAYTYDSEKGWYTFEGQYEPIFAKDSFWALEEDDSFAADMRENYVYETWIAQETDIAIPSHYYSENGPIERDVTMYFPYEHNDLPYKVMPAVYTYQDERMDISITIEYPRIYYSESEMEDAINEKIKEAFFYSYFSDEDSDWNPVNKIYTSINRQYFITREDENYFSLRIYEDNDMRGANHPNEWETGLTIDMQTGEVLRLEDVVGEEWTPEALLECGDFECLWTWEGDSQDYWMEQARERAKDETLSDYDSYFYLTDEKLGLITSQSRYYTCMEADFADFGVTGFTD